MSTFPLSIQKANFKVSAKFPSLNKNNTWEEYEFQMIKTEPEAALVTEIIVLTDESFEEFKDSLLEDYHFLQGKGGIDSDADLREVNNFYEYSPDEQKAWIKESYRLCVLIQNTKGENILVDPQGYSYARYCGKIS